MSENKYTDECSHRKYFTQTTNIIFHLGLTAYEIALYMAIKRTSGDNGISKKGTKSLALESGMSIGQVVSTKEKLCNSRNEIGGKSLIRIEKTIHESGGNGVDNIFVTDLWDENYEFFNKNKKKNTYSPHEPPYSPHEPPYSPHEPKKNLNRNNLNRNNLNKNNLNKKDIPKGIYKEKSAKASHTPKFINISREDTIEIREEVHLTQEQINEVEKKYPPELLEIMYDKLNIQHISIKEGVVTRKKPYTFSVFYIHSWLWDAATKCLGSSSFSKSSRSKIKSEQDNGRYAHIEPEVYS